MYSIAIDLPNLPEGGTLIIDGLGEFTNGTTTDVSEEDALSYQSRNAEIESDYDDEGKLHTSLKAGKTLLEVFANHPFIKVTDKSATSAAPKIVTPLVTPLSVVPSTDLTNS